VLITFKFPGEWYHNNKKAFEKARKAYADTVPLEFKGFQDMGWKSQFEDIKVDAVRVTDPKTGREHSESVTIYWEGERETELLKWMKVNWKDFELNPLGERLKKFDEETSGKVKRWKESLNRPPDSFLEAYLRDRTEKRKLIEGGVEVKETPPPTTDDVRECEENDEPY
jgi:hypothetical protein